MRSHKFNIVIPARLGSSRLPGKPLLDIAGKPMIYHVCERALEAGADCVVVATDDLRIVDAVSGLEVEALLTRADHNSGTERIAEVCEKLHWADDQIVVNLQGDEPLMLPGLIGQLAETLAEASACEVATLAACIHDCDEVFNPSAVKVVLDSKGYALYFSRAPIPWHRDTFSQNPEGLVMPYLRHIGMYAYRAGFLRRYIGWPASQLESIESLEQLRILWYGERIRVLTVDEAPEAGVDTQDDLHRVQQKLKQC